MQVELYFIILTVALSAFFSGAEVAIVATSKLKAEQLVHNKVRNADALLKLKKKPNESLITILIGNNVVNVASSALATKVALDFFNNVSIGIVTGVMTLVILTFGEIIPKTYVSKNAKSIALKIAPILLVLSYVFYPLVKGFNYLSLLMTRWLGSSDKDPLVTEREIKYLVHVGTREGEINKNEKSIINRVFKLDDLSVSKIMTPAKDVFSLDWNLTVEQAMPLIIEHGYTRMPVHSGNKGNIKGMLTIQDVVGQIYQGNNSIKLKSIMNPIYFVSRNKKLDETLKELQLRNYHLAIVLGVHKQFVGLITVEDILEELVGEIFDEEDRVDHLIEQVSDVEWLVKGKTFIRTINKKLNLSLPITNEFKPVSRFLMERLDSVYKGKVYLCNENKVSITVEQVHKDKIGVVSIKKF